jgi:hypothetical protein
MLPKHEIASQRTLAMTGREKKWNQIRDLLNLVRLVMGDLSVKILGWVNPYRVLRKDPRCAKGFVLH